MLGCYIMNNKVEIDRQANPDILAGERGFWMKKNDLTKKCGHMEWKPDDKKKPFEIGKGKYDKDKCIFENTSDTRTTAALVFGTTAQTRVADKRLSAWGGCFDDNKKTEWVMNKFGEKYEKSTITDITDETQCNSKGYRWNPDYLRKGVGKDSFDKNGHTLSNVVSEINNGRVHDINVTSNVHRPKPKDALSQLIKRGDVIMKQDNQSTAVKGIVDETALSTIYFSEINTNIIQQTLRYKVYEKTKQIVDYQSSEALYIVMRSILLQHANFRVDGSDLAFEIRKLNFYVVKYCVDEVSANVLQYKGYIKDVGKLPDPMLRPKPADDDFSSRNKAFDLSNHTFISTGGWGARHMDRGD
jgi:hypothetical protein